MTKASGSRQRRQTTERAPSTTSVDALPNDLLVSIFHRFLLAENELAPESARHRRRRTEALRWVRETFPRVCRRWRDLYRSQQASPLHATLEIDSEVEGGRGARRQTLRGERVIAWARAHARDVRTLRVVGERRPREFAQEHLETLLEVLAPSLDSIEIELEASNLSLAAPSFWESSMAGAVAPRGRLRRLVVREIRVPLPAARTAFLSRLTRLEELVLHASPRPATSGLRALPESLRSLAGSLRRLDLSYNGGIASPPAWVSSLSRLESLRLRSCGLRSPLPDELGALLRLTELDLQGNVALGDAGADVAFPAALRGGLSSSLSPSPSSSSLSPSPSPSSLRKLVLRNCHLRSVPSVVCQLERLEFLDMSSNPEVPTIGHGGERLRGIPPLEFPAGFSEVRSLTHLDLSCCSLASVPGAVLASMPRLRSLSLAQNEDLSDLPDDMGRRLRDLREINLSYAALERVPLRALAGATALEKINLWSCHDLEAPEPLDFDGFPRLRKVKMSRLLSEYSDASLRNLERSAARLRETNPAAVLDFEVIGAIPDDL